VGCHILRRQVLPVDLRHQHRQDGGEILCRAVLKRRERERSRRVLRKDDAEAVGHAGDGLVDTRREVYDVDLTRRSDLQYKRHSALPTAHLGDERIVGGRTTGYVPSEAA
jgi:hypothetical protein